MRNRSLFSAHLALVAILFVSACGSDRRGSGNESDANMDATSGDASSWTCDVAEYYECVGADQCTGAAQCLADGKTLGSCRCSNAGDASMDALIDVCVPDQSYACNGAGGCNGLATCESDGRALGVCNCPDASVDASLGDNRCDNATDLAGVEATYPLGTFTELLDACQLVCAFTPGPTCLTDCMAPQVQGAVSSACLSCYDRDVTCRAATGCDLLCALPSTCTPCICGDLGGRACADEFDTCRGIATNTCDS